MYTKAWAPVTRSRATLIRPRTFAQCIVVQHGAVAPRARQQRGTVQHATCVSRRAVCVCVCVMLVCRAACGSTACAQYVCVCELPLGAFRGHPWRDGDGDRCWRQHKPFKSFCLLQSSGPASRSGGYKKCWQNVFKQLFALFWILEWAHPTCGRGNVATGMLGACLLVLLLMMLLLSPVPAPPARQPILAPPACLTQADRQSG